MSKHPVWLQRRLQEQGVFEEGFLSLARVEERLMRCYAEIPQSNRFLEILKLSGCSQGWHKLGNPAEACKITSPF